MEWMILPVLATAVIVLTLGWFGLHVLQRGQGSRFTSGAALGASTAGQHQHQASMALFWQADPSKQGVTACSGAQPEQGSSGGARPSTREHGPASGLRPGSGRVSR